MISGACMAMGIGTCYSLFFFFLFSIINKDKIKKKKKREEYFNFNIKQIFWILLGRSTCRKSSTGSNKRLIFVMVESSSCSATWFLITSTCCSTHKYIQVVIFFYFILFFYLFIFLLRFLFLFFNVVFGRRLLCKLVCKWGVEAFNDPSCSWVMTSISHKNHSIPCVSRVNRPQDPFKL